MKAKRLKELTAPNSERIAKAGGYSAFRQLVFYDNEMKKLDGYLAMIAEIDDIIAEQEGYIKALRMAQKYLRAELDT